MESKFALGDYVKSIGTLSPTSYGQIVGVLDGEVYASAPGHMNHHLWYTTFHEWWTKPVYHVSFDMPVPNAHSNPVAAKIMIFVEDELELSTKDAWVEDLGRELDKGDDPGLNFGDG